MASEAESSAAALYSRLASTLCARQRTSGFVDDRKCCYKFADHSDQFIEPGSYDTHVDHRLEISVAAIFDKQRFEPS